MPSLFSIDGYRVFFWSAEGNEPIHVHVGKGKPSPNATKLWLTRGGGCIVASNGSKIPTRELDKLMRVIEAQHRYIESNWRDFFGDDAVRYYC